MLRGVLRVSGLPVRGTVGSHSGGAGLSDGSRHRTGVAGRTGMAGRIGVGVRLGAWAAAAGLLALAGCASVDQVAVIPDVTNAPAQGFEKVGPGSEQDFILNVGRRTYFDANAADLDETAMRTLDKQALWLRANGKWYVKLQGHADDKGDEGANTALSDRRAKAVMDYLIKQGVPASRLWAKGYGRERLVRDCADIECKAQNRRVVSNLRLQKDESAPD